MDFEQLGPYKIGHRLGKGGMGSVYRGVNVETGEPAAIKALAPQLAMAEGFRERFEAEIESLEMLKHPGIVRLFGYGEEAGTLFYAMEIVEGRSLEGELKAGRRFTWREVVDISIQVCKSLKHAHDHGIIHRDIKPANILLSDQDEGDQVKLADFGIARLFGGSQLTMAGGVLGTADYMSPEQAEGTPVTDRSDQYSLGCVMYALLAGRPPFQANNLPEMLQLQRYAEPDPVRRYAPRTPAQLEIAIAQLLSKDPADRFPNTMVLARHLEAMRRALSQPTKMEDEPPASEGEDSLEAKSDSHQDPSIEMAETQAADDEADSELSRIASRIATDSVELDGVSTSLREAATIDSPLLEEQDEPSSSVVANQDHFTQVTGQRSDRSAIRFTPSMLAAGAGLVALVAAAGWMVWSLAQPYDADGLYAIIHPDKSVPEIEQLRSHSNQIDEFLERFPDDQRVAEVRDYAQELSLNRMEQRFATLARGRGRQEELPTAERLYLRALQIAVTDPARAVEQLDDLIVLFDSPASSDSETNNENRRLQACLELAKRQKARLTVQLKAQRTLDLATLHARLVVAQSLQGEHPERSRALCLAIIDLYQPELWAAEAVAEAEGLLQKLNSPAASPPSDTASKSQEN